jgi:hypothetical protein
MTEGNPRGMEESQSVPPRQPGEPSTNKPATSPERAPEPAHEPAPPPAKPAAKPAVQSTAKDKE